jgi:hypothetical protein
MRNIKTEVDCCELFKELQTKHRYDELLTSLIYDLSQQFEDRLL